MVTNQRKAPLNSQRMPSPKQSGRTQDGATMRWLKRLQVLPLRMRLQHPNAGKRRLEYAFSNLLMSAGLAFIE